MQSTCFDLADCGILRYDFYNKCVSLGSPQVLIDLVDGASTVTIEEIIALRTFNQGIRNNDLAGDVTLRLIARAASKPAQQLAFGFAITSISRAVGAAPLALPQLSLDGTVQHGVSGVIGRMWKEGRDRFGADGVVLEQCSSGGDETPLCAHRIQVKIRGNTLFAAGEAISGGACVDDVIKRFKEMEAMVDGRYGAAGLLLGRQRCILATIQDVTLGARHALQAAGIELWDQRWLAEHVWPPSVRRLNKRFGGGRR